MYLRWMAENMWLFVPAQVYTRQWLETFKEFPPRGGTASKPPPVASNNYNRWWIERSAFSVTAIQEIGGGFMGTFKDFPPRQKPAKCNVGDIMAQMYKTGAH